MRSVELKPGEVLYQEGDASECVYFVESGEVEVRRGVGLDEVGLATLGKGQILGEMGVVRGEPRSASIVALTPARLAQVDAADFMKAFGGADGLGLKILRMICNRLSETNVGVGVGMTTTKSYAVRGDIDEIRLLGASSETRAMLGPAGIVVSHLPFEVGGVADDAGSGPEIRRESLALPGGLDGVDLARRHFRIELGHDGAMQVRSLEGRVGCLVNQTRISCDDRPEEPDVAPLSAGDNKIVAGGARSAARFTLRLRRFTSSAA